MEPDQQLRNLRDFLLVYNRMTETCFQRCTSNFNYRSLTMDEERCVDSCAGKLIRTNHRLMGTYVQLMPKMVQRRMEEMESKAAEHAKAAEALASGSVGPGTTEGSPAVPPHAGTGVEPVQTPTVPQQATDTSVVSSLSPVSDEATVRPDVHGSVDVPFELDAAAPLTSATETANRNKDH